MKITKNRLVAAGLAIISPFAIAAEQPGLQAQADGLAYVGSNGRIGLGYDTKTKIRGEAYWIFSEKELAAWIGEGWASGGAGGLKLNYQWVPASTPEQTAEQTVRKIFAAVDRNDQHDQKFTLGGGLERENLFLGGYVSAAVSGRRITGNSTSTRSETLPGAEPDGRLYTQDMLTTTHIQRYESPYDYGVGTRVGRYFSEPLIRLSGGLDYEWGRSSSHQTSFSVMLEKFIANTPHSFSVNAEVHQKAGGLEQKTNDQRLYFMYRYEIGGKSYRPERESRMVERMVAAPPPQPVEPISSPVESKPRIEKRMVKTTASMFSDAFFEFDSARLTPEAKAALNSVAETLRKASYSGNIHVTGHTCDIGTDQYNQKLSERRAQSVRKYLIDSGVVSAETVVAEGEGENNPRYPNIKDSRYKNRRVDLEFVTFVEKTEEIMLPPEPQPAVVTPKPVVQPAKVEWVREFIDTEPVWLRRALHNTLPHKQSVDVYRQESQDVSVTSGDKHYLGQPPIARADTFYVPTSIPTVLNVMANDSDPDGDALTIVSFTQPGDGTGVISQGSNGTLVFTPSGVYPWNHFASTSFSYTISDGTGYTASAAVTLIDP